MCYRSPRLYLYGWWNWACADNRWCYRFEVRGSTWEAHLDRLMMDSVTNKRLEGGGHRCDLRPNVEDVDEDANACDDGEEAGVGELGGLSCC